MNSIRRHELKKFLEEKYFQYHSPDFIESDPISIPHLFSKKEDIEISGFLTSTISWGQRPVILKNARELIRRMDHAPFDFIKSFSSKEAGVFQNYVHRTFQTVDCLYFLQALQQIYLNHDGLERLFHNSLQEKSASMAEAINTVRRIFFSWPHPKRSEKHFSDPVTGAFAKRINMFLRWMVRKDVSGVDFGLWRSIPPSKLHCPLDVHSGRVARRLGILSRTQNDWKAVVELTDSLRQFDPDDPVKYDFALFGLGVFERF